MSVSESYRDFDLHGGGGLWPASIPSMTGPEAVAAAKKLWRKFAGRSWPGTWKKGRGNHRSYPRDTVFLVNPGQGWKGVVHDLSHALWDRLTIAPRHSTIGPRLRVKGEMRQLLSKAVFDEYRSCRNNGHTFEHAQLERAMIQMVIDSGWLAGTLKKPAKVKPPKPAMVEVAKPSRREKNEALVDAAIIRWTAKLAKAKKAVTAAEKRLKELANKKRYYDRQRA
jgi:hypothetical protein